MSDSTAAEKGAKGKKSPLPMIIGIVVLALILFLGKGMLGGAKAEEKNKDKKHVEEVGVQLPLDEFMVNLSGGGDHYLRTTIALGLKKGLTEEQAKEHVAPMRDAILSVLSSKTLKDLSKAEGRDQLKGELKEKINDAAGEEPVVKVYFTAFATQ